MNNQTENYVILKPIAERFNLVAKEITDNDIKYIIKEAMKEQIKGIFDFNKLNEMTEEFIDKNEDKIKCAIADCIFNKLK
ncbi:MAG: hypothetical protein A2Y34_03910 [Spirochaetes bacterium GWC1_27_15]|nr:MAG: hypothetical protein A2Y34_03910 [Spirochaetes bacterium GWC1_27_15]